MLGMIASVGLYVGLICHPGSFFSHAFTRGGITLYSDEPIPPEHAGRILNEAAERLTRSPLATPARDQNLRIYICNRHWRFTMFANTRYKVGGLAYPPLSENIFFEEGSFPHQSARRLLGQGSDRARTLSYYIAHEIMHVLVAKELESLSTGGCHPGKMRDTPI